MEVSINKERHSIGGLKVYKSSEPDGIYHGLLWEAKEKSAGALAEIF